MRKKRKKFRRKLVAAMNPPKIDLCGSAIFNQQRWLIFLFFLLLLPFFCVAFSTFNFFFFWFSSFRSSIDALYLLNCMCVVPWIYRYRHHFKTDYVKMFSFVQQNKKNDCDAYVYAKLSNCRELVDFKSWESAWVWIGKFYNPLFTHESIAHGDC